MRQVLDKYPTQPRYAMVVLEGGVTEHRAFDDLKKGDVFFLLEPSTDSLVEHRGNAQWRAMEDSKDGQILCESAGTP